MLDPSETDVTTCCVDVTAAAWRRHDPARDERAPAQEVAARARHPVVQGGRRAAAAAVRVCILCHSGARLAAS